MTLSKLSLRNARRQARDYLVYFTTVTLAAALIYAFNAMIFSDRIRELSGMMQSLGFIIVAASVVVVGIIGWLVSYTTRFMLEKRSRELGTYILLGMENHQVARLFFLENLAVGGAAMALGVLLGNLIFGALEAITMAMFGQAYTFSFTFSLGAVLLTIGYFALIYLQALLRSRGRIRKMKIYDLLYLDKQNQKEAMSHQKSRVALFAASIAMGIGGVLVFVFASSAWVIDGALLIAALYGFFISFSSGVPGYFDRRPAKKYKGSTLLIFRSLTSKLATMGVLMGTIAVLFTGSLGIAGSGMVIQGLLDHRAEQTTAFDLYVGSSDMDEERAARLDAYVRETVPVAASYRYDLYQAENDQVLAYVLREHAEQIPYTEYTTDVLMRYSDYAALRQIFGYAPAEPLGEGEYLIHAMAFLKGTLSAYDEPITVDGKTFTKSPRLYTESFLQRDYNGNGNGDGYTLVLPDAALRGRPVHHGVYGVMTEAPVGEEPYLAIKEFARSGLPLNLGSSAHSKALARAEQASTSALMVFPMYYLVLVLTMVAATILSIQLLSDANRYRRQYALLDNLGMERRAMSRALFRQFALFYTMPTIPAILISTPLVLALAGAVDTGVITGPWHLLAILGTELAVFFGIYLLYILAAYQSFKKSVLPTK